MRIADEVAIEGDRVTVGQHGARRADAIAASGLNADGAAGPNVDVHHPCLGYDSAVARLQSRHERFGEGRGAALRYREAVVLPERGHHPPEQPAARALRADVGVQRVAGEQQAAALAAERLLGQPPDRHDGEAAELEPAPGTDLQTELGAGSQRWKRAEQRVDERAADPVEAR